MHAWTLDAEFLCLAVDALTSSALGIDRVVERIGAIHQNASAASKFVVDVLLAPFAFLELLMLARLASGIREEGEPPEDTEEMFKFGEDALFTLLGRLTGDLPFDQLAQAQINYYTIELVQSGNEAM